MKTFDQRSEQFQRNSDRFAMIVFGGFSVLFAGVLVLAGIGLLVSGVVAVLRGL